MLSPKAQRHKVPRPKRLKLHIAKAHRLLAYPSCSSISSVYYSLSPTVGLTTKSMSTSISFASSLPPLKVPVQKPINRIIKELPILHGNLLKSGSLSDIYNYNTLIHKYAETGQISHAHNLFDEMSERNLVSWTSLISGYTRLGKHNEALKIFIHMLDSGFCPNEFAFGSVLGACTKSGHERFGTQLHGLIVKTGLIENEFVDSGLIVMYSKYGDLGTANGILLRMNEKDPFSWTSMVVGYSNGGCSLEAVMLFARMIEEDIQPSKFTLTSVLKACSSLGEGAKEGSQVHGYALKTGLEEDISIRVSLIDIYTKMGDLRSAELIYERSLIRDVMLCTVMIGGCAINGKPELGIDFFVKMLQECEIFPNEYTFCNVITACAGLSDPVLATCLHAFVIKTGYSSVVNVEGALINVYAKTGNMKRACRVFDRMVDKDAISCSSILAGFSSNGQDQEALEFYSNLHKTVKPDPFSLACCVVSCAKLADQLRGRQLHAQVIKHGHESDTCISSALLDMYSKSGTLEDARRVFDELKDKDRIVWTAMIDGYAQHGQARKALEVFERMKQEGIKPNEVTFVSVLYACSHAGLVEEGLNQFHLMSSSHGIKPVIHHYACVVDLLGRAGRLEEALELIKVMPIEPTSLVWRAFMGACRTHNNLKLGIHASKQLLNLDPNDDSAYILLANMYAEAGHWNESFLVRKAMKKNGVKKVPGLSWIEAGKTFHVFGARDKIHPQKELIYKILDDLKPEMKNAGYFPQTGFANTEDMDEEEEEKLVCHHSEKLAVGFGLMNCPVGIPIRIFKNLRVCGDCHNAIKVISLIREREIIVRDVSRFHHFRDGACSCGDYW